MQLLEPELAKWINNGKTTGGWNSRTTEIQMNRTGWTASLYCTTLPR